MNSRASTNPPILLSTPPSPTLISQFRRYYQQTYCYKSTHSIVTYLYSIQRLLHCNLSDIKGKMMHSYYSSIYNTTIFSIVKKNSSPPPFLMTTPPLYVFFSHTTPFQFIMTPPNYKVELYRQPPLLIIPPPTIRVRSI